jgi:hypothetical protein
MTTQLKFDTPLIITGNTKEAFDEFYSKKIRIELLDSNASNYLTRLENIAFLLEASFCLTDGNSKITEIKPIRYSNLFYDNSQGYLHISKNKRICYINIVPYPSYSSYEAYFSNEVESKLQFEYTLKHIKDNSLGNYIIFLVS